MPGIFSRRRDQGKPGKQVRWNSPVVTQYFERYGLYGSPPGTPMNPAFYWPQAPPPQVYPSTPYNAGVSFPDMNSSTCGTPLRRRSSFTSSFTAPQWAQNGTPLNRWGSLQGRTQTPRFTSAFVPPPTPQASHTRFDSGPTQHPTPTGNIRSSPWHSPANLAPALPAETPSMTRWDYPEGTLIWSPHPAPHPHVPASEFWNTAGILQGPQPTPRMHSCEVPLAVVSGGCPMPGSSPWWTPGTWPPSPWGNGVPVKLAPCLIPNPSNSLLPQVVWDVAQNPAKAQRITGSHTLVPLNTMFNQQATSPAANEVQIGVQVAQMEKLWGPITVSSSKAVTVWDLLNGIYTYLQTPLKQQEVDYLQSLDPANYDILSAACYARSNVTPGLPGYEAAQGLKRVDLLGDTRVFWGLWVSVDPNDCWHLNLGLVNMRPGMPVR